MSLINCLWAQQPDFVEFFHKAPSMSTAERLDYFHQIFPDAESLPVNFYLTDTSNINLACNQTTIQTLGDKSAADYFGFPLDEYLLRKEWPNHFHDIIAANNELILSERKTAMLQEPVLHNFIEKSLLSIKEPIVDDNNTPIGIVGISILIEQSSERPVLHHNKFFDIALKAPQIANTIFSALPLQYALKKPENPMANFFSPREMDCINLLLFGYSYKHIANKLDLSSRTVESYIENIKIKLNCNNKQRLIEKLLDMGFTRSL